MVLLNGQVINALLPPTEISQKKGVSHFVLSILVTNPSENVSENNLQLLHPI